MAKYELNELYNITYPFLPTAPSFHHHFSIYKHEHCIIDY